MPLHSKNIELHKHGCTYCKQAELTKEERATIRITKKPWRFIKCKYKNLDIYNFFKPATCFEEEEST